MATMVLGALLLPAAAQAAADLTVTDSGILDPTVASGARTKIVVPVRNLGRSTAPATTLTFFLSTDARLGRDRTLAGVGRVPSLRARGSRDVTTLVTLPRGLKPDDYRIFACVDQRGAVPESNDRNNCSKVPEPIAIERLATRVKVTPQAATGGFVGDATVSTAGGLVVSSGPDGTIYMLYVPAGALPFDTHITVTPLASIGGMPFASPMVAGVQLEPNGLEFARPATLIISGPAITPNATQRVFGFSKGGADLHLATQFRAAPAEAATMDPAHTVYLPVEHFSGAGLVPTTDQEAAVQQRKGAAAARDRLAQEADKELHKPDGDLDPLWEAYVDEVLMPEAAAASFSDAMYLSAIRDYISWQRQRELLGVGSDTSARLKGKLVQLQKLLDEAWKHVIKRAEERCQTGGFDVIGRIVPLERERQMLGLDSTPNEFSAVVERCWRFELRIRSTVKRDIDGGVQGLSGSEHMTWVTEAKVPLKVQGESGGIEVALGQLVGAGDLVYTTRAYTGSGEVDFGTIGHGTCSYSFGGETQAGSFDVSDGSIITKWDGPLEPYFTFTLGNPQELIAQHCQGESVGQPWTDDTPQWQHHWLRWWRSSHGDWSASSNVGGDEDNGPWTVHLKPGRHPIVGTLTFNDSAPSSGYSLTETWTLEHKPLKAAS